MALLVLWFTCCLAVVTIARTKHPWYIIPAYPGTQLNDCLPGRWLDLRCGEQIVQSEPA